MGAAMADEPVDYNNLEHDTFEDARRRQVPPPRPPPPDRTGRFKEVRDEMKEARGDERKDEPWCSANNPAIWSGDVSDLYDD